MMHYLIILLDDTSTSYCHYCNSRTKRRLMSIDDLRQGILFAMKENLMIGFVYPDYPLPQEYVDVIDSIDHSDIVSSTCKDVELLSIADVIVFNGWVEITNASLLNKDAVYILRTDKSELFLRYPQLIHLISNAARLNVVITDVETFTDEDFEQYKAILQSLADEVGMLYVRGKRPQLNLLTDRIMLDRMNNCNAGVDSITLAPDGRFYVCPAFYFAGEDSGLGEEKFSTGCLDSGLDLRNQQLYRLNYAPLCRRCDAYQCKRCVWLNWKTTCEVNTPSHEQCVAAHLERNASRLLLHSIRSHGTFLPDKEIEEITYLDPFDIREI